MIPDPFHELSEPCVLITISPREYAQLKTELGEMGVTLKRYLDGVAGTVGSLFPGGLPDDACYHLTIDPNYHAPGEE